ncbi:hypothetical protein [Bradyrhizobium sp. Gha]|uniref:hypothetical protein n=1 Tax=Bradyrhizobium sp. Gha TaxID=1855318 RepID=UPI0008EEFE71|nr:hypothetical protein [Bradyrhizobium sp. Gha]SFK19167.1 hypothetical protein SAMN05216525_1613 [Bradyrhizobium sp. Gha]
MQTIDDLRETVRKLDATGPNGFEGLMAAVLTELTGRTFALASSGSQRGKDGQSVLDDGAISFEGKLYEDAVAKDQILSKIAEIAADEEGQTELWILASTGPISVQHINTAQKAGKKLGIAVKVLSWPATGLSELAALLAMAPVTSADFLARNTSTSHADVVAQLQAATLHPQFPARSAELKADLQQPSLAPAFALQDNIAWLSAAFADKKLARVVFGQALSPDDASTAGVLDRPDLRAKLADVILAKPDGSVAAILGADGNGKSWIFAQAWTHQQVKPLTIILLPDDFKLPSSLESMRDLLIAKLIGQTGDNFTAIAENRWRDHLKRWRQHKNTDKPRLVVFVDGLNQREIANWPHLIDILSELLAEIGGKLVISCRTLFYRDQLEGRLVSNVRKFDVPEWSDSELESLLAPLGTSILQLNADVVRSLRNPRLFGIAAALLKDRKIDEFGELSVNRLLFEHIRLGAVSDSNSIAPRQFVQDIRLHADQIIKRLKDNQKADLTVFDRPSPFAGHSPQTVAEQFALISAGRFFEILADDPAKYILKEDGLSLALGLSLVSSARTALRQGKNVLEALGNVLDPIAALDRTSDVLIAAIVACVLDEAPKEVTAALVQCFIALQNLDQTLYPEFQALLRQDPVSFLAALENSALTERVTANQSWLIQAVQDGRATPACSAALKDAIRRWLSMYSDQPERMMAPTHQGAPDEKRKEERAKREGEIADKLKTLCDSERVVLDGLILQKHGDYSRLSALAFQFLGGYPLAEYADSFRNWAFAAAFNGGFRNHHQDFNDLIQLNVTDWSETRTAILESAKVLQGPGTSETGRWALAYLLYATADSDDAAVADEIVQALPKDRERFGGWRLVEDYCATDPCDPSSSCPANIEKTAQRYLKIDVSKLRLHMGNGQEDHFFEMARAGLSRFEPHAAVEVMRRFADQALSRSTDDFRIAAFTLEKHTAALDAPLAQRFIAKAAELATEALEGDENDQKHVAAQYALLIAFPHMSGDDQLDALLAHPKDATFVRGLADLFQPCDPTKLEADLAKAIADGNEVAQFRALAFAEHSRTPLTQRTIELAGDLFSSTHRHVRLSCLGLIRASQDAGLLAAVISSGWTATALDSAADRVEISHGSEALVLASKLGLISIETCLERIDFSAYRKLVELLGSPAASAIAGRLDIAIEKAAGFKIRRNLPDIEQRVEDRHWSSLLSVSDRPSSNKNFSPEQLRELSEAGDAWYERQKRNYDAAEQFERELSEAGAQLIIRSVTSGLIREIDKASPQTVDKWLKLFLTIDQEALNNLHNTASAVAEAVSYRDSAGALALMGRLAQGAPPVRATFGTNHLRIDAVTVWSAVTDVETTALRFARLDRIGNDYDLANEVLAAIRANREVDVRDFVLDRRVRVEPAHRARAAMLAGLSPAEPWALETIEMLKDSKGFLHAAYKGATYAMDRHRWSKHWSHLMATATSLEDLWRYSVLLCKIVDGRFKPSDLATEAPNPLLERFAPTFESGLADRIKRWKNHRDSKLFGMQAPNPIFLPH